MENGITTSISTRSGECECGWDIQLVRRHSIAPVAVEVLRPSL